MKHTAPCGLVLLIVLVVLGVVPRAAAQAPLYLANDSTTVRGIGFKFVESGTFEADVLEQHIATEAPSFFDRVRRVLPFISAPTYPLDPIELQRDVVRLRHYYRDNGFLHPSVTYAASQLDTTNNTIRVIFSIDEGPPLIIQDVAFFSPQNTYMASYFSGKQRERWIQFRDRTSFKTGDRYTDFDLVRIQDAVLSWMKDQGYAFAQLDTQTDVDSTYNTVDIRFTLDPGPLGYFSEILIEGNESVSDNVVRRELPFSVGDRFSYSKLVQGQRELFSLNLFRVALADVPPAYGASGPEVDSLETLRATDDGVDLRQPRDSTVLVRYRLREAKLRYVTAQTGYSRDLGIALQGQWTHRNFLGAARNFTATLIANTGLLARPSAGLLDPPRLFRGSVALRQPYLFTTKLSAIVEPFIQYERDPLLQDSDRLLNINRREFGFTGTLIYDIYPFRNVSLQYNLSRVDQFTEQKALGIVADSLINFAPYNKSILTLNGTFGWTNDFLNPRRGFLIRPLLEEAGGLLASGVEYLKTGTEVVGYMPVTRRISAGARLFAGRLWPVGQSRGSVMRTVAGTSFMLDEQFVQPTEDRFDPIRFYTGGSNDVRGWALRLLGPKTVRFDYVRDSTGAVLFEPDTGYPRTSGERYEAVGGLAKLAGNIELRLPFPGLSNSWRTAVFLDFGQVSARRVDQDCPAPRPSLPEGTIQEIQLAQCGFRDTGNLRLGRLKYGLGTGVRYETPVGYIRLDIAYKLNPDDLDLMTPRNAFLWLNGYLDEPKKDWLGRVNLHLSLGQAF